MKYSHVSIMACPPPNRHPSWLSGGVANGAATPCGGSVVAARVVDDTSAEDFAVDFEEDIGVCDLKFRPTTFLNT